MSYTNKKITQAEINAHHVQGATDYLIGNAQQNKAVFDDLPEFIANRINELIDDLDTQQGEGIQETVDEWLEGHPEATTTVEDNSLTTAKYKDDSVTASKIASGAVTPEKLDRPYATEETYEQSLTEQAAINANLTNEINVLDSRMDEFASLPPGSTSGNAELVDIRAGANGTTYSSAGDAVRGQVNALKSDINGIISDTDLIVHTGYYLGGDGRLTTATSNAEVYTDKISVASDDKVWWNIANSSNATYIWLGYCFYDANSMIVGTRQTLVEKSSSSGALWNESGSLTIPSNVHFVSFTYTTAGNATLRARKAEEIGDAAKERISFTTAPGYYSGDGDITSPSSDNEVYTSRIPVVAGETLYIDYKLQAANAIAKQWIAYMLYNANGAVISSRQTLFNDFSTEYVKQFTVPQGASYISFTYRTYSGNNDFIIRRNVTNSIELLNEKRTYIEVTDSYESFLAGWFRYSDAYYSESSGATTRVYSAKNVKHVKAFLSGDYASVVAIGFYNSETPSEGSYMKSASLPYRRSTQSGWWYYADVPDGAVTLTVSSLRNFEPHIFFDAEGILDTAKHNDKAFPLLYDKFYYHGLTDHVTDGTDTDIVIPAQSIYDVAIAKRLGFTFIEANVQATGTAGKYVVTHGINYQLGYDFERVDGTPVGTDRIYNIPFDTLRSDYRYRSVYEKYRVPITTLEEFLYQCKNLSIYPLLQYWDNKSLEIARNVVGDNMIVYTYHADKTREVFNGFIMEFRTDDSKEAMLARCEEIGKPYMYCLSNPNDYTSDELTQMISLLHQHGYYIGFAGNYYGISENTRLMKLGFDFASSAGYVNDFDNGNLIDVSCDEDYSGIETTGNVNDGVLTLTQGDTIRIANNASGIKKYIIKMNVNGTIEVKRPAFSEYGADVTETITATNYIDTVISGTAFFKNVDITITAQTNVSINSLVVKVSKC